MRQRVCLSLLLIWLLWAHDGKAAQQITLGTPILRASITDYRPLALFVQRTDLAMGMTAQITVFIAGTDHQREVFQYPCVNRCAAMDTATEVDAVITALNTANLSTRSLWHRIFDRLVLDFPERFAGGGTVQ